MYRYEHTPTMKQWREEIEIRDNDVKFYLKNAGSNCIIISARVADSVRALIIDGRPTHADLLRKSKYYSEQIEKYHKLMDEYNSDMNLWGAFRIEWAVYMQMQAIIENMLRKAAQK